VAADGIVYELTRARLADREETTVYLLRYPRDRTRVRLVCFQEATRLDQWCVAEGHPEAVVGGFFLREPWRPLGEVRLRGQPVAHEPIEEPWAAQRGTVAIDGDVRIVARAELPGDFTGDLVQAGPILVSEGRSRIDGDDREGFSAGAGQFDSDITAARHPRCALGLSERELLVVCCDGRRTGVDAGLLLDELARLLITFGADDAINLDGGGSATLVHRGHLLNRPYSNRDQPAPESRPLVTALLFEPA
jgi:hypothetical protein